jgi:hypothetical protein
MHYHRPIVKDSRGAGVRERPSEFGGNCYPAFGSPTMRRGCGGWRMGTQTRRHVISDSTLHEVTTWVERWVRHYSLEAYVVYEPSADYEKSIIEAVVAFLEKQFGEPLTSLRWHDKEVRNSKAVELLADGPTRGFAIEHTRLNSFEGQIGDDAQLIEKLWPIVPILGGSVPGRFELAIQAGAISKLNRQRLPVALAEIVVWIRTVAGTLQPRRESEDDEDGTFSVAARLPNVPFELQLTRLSSRGSEVFIARQLPPNWKTQHSEDVARALAMKNPKLAQSAEGRVRLLVLETRDFQLQNAAAVGRALEQAASARTDMPELVYLVETDFGSWHLYVLKDGDAYATKRSDDVGPFVIGVTPPHESRG